MTPSVVDGEEFLRRVETSRLLDPGRLIALMDAAGQPAEELAALLVRERLLTPFQAEEILAGREKGLVVAGKYRLLKLLGAGGMGRVYLAEHVKMRRKVALKMLPDEQLRPGSVERFYREARAAAALNHPNIVQAHDIDQDGPGRHFFVMEFVDGRSLEDIVQAHGPLDVGLAVAYVIQAAQGLQYAYEKEGLIHRDIKPANLLLDRAGVVKILDLGLARFLHDASDKLSLNPDQPNLLGTVDYLSPEQGQDSHHVDVRTDIYGLGGTLYTLLTGRRPLGEGTIGQKLLWVQMRDPLPMRPYRPEIPEKLEAVVRRMMAKDRDRRYASAAEAGEALRPWAAPPSSPPPSQWLPPAEVAPPTLMGDPITPVQATPLPTTEAPTLFVGRVPVKASPTPPPGRRPAPPPRRVWPWVAGGAALIAVAAVATFWLWPRGQDETPKGRLPTTLLVDDSGLPDRFRTIGAALAAAIKGDRVLVRVPRWREAVRVSGGLRCGGEVTIEGRLPEPAPGKAAPRVVWEPPEGHPANRPLLEVSGASSFALEGFRLDGGGACEDLVRASGVCRGLRLTDVELVGFTRAGVRAHGLAGDPLPTDERRRPATLSRLFAKPARADASGVVIEARGGACNYLEVSDGRFDGPGRAALLVTGECDHIELRHNRISGLDGAVAYAPDDGSPPAAVRVTGNTAFRCRTFLSFVRAAGGKYGPWRVENNLLVGLKAAVEVGGKPASKTEPFLLPPKYNAAGEDGLPGAAALGLRTVPAGTLETEAANARDYLRYGKDSPLTTAADGKPVGVPPLTE